MSKNVGFVGVGTIGEPMAASLLRNGFQLTICPHTNLEPVERLRALGAHVVASPRDVGAVSDVIVTCVPNSPQVDEVCLGPNGIVLGARPGTVILDASTIAPTESQRIAVALKLHDIDFMDCPMSGGPARAKTGELTFMVGGDAAAFEKALPVLQGMGKSITHMGDVGSGEVVKLVNQAILASLMIGMAEAFTMGVKAGGDAMKMREVILKATGANFLLENWIKDRMLKDDYTPGFATKLMQKDVGVVLETAAKLGVPMMLTGLAFQLFELSEGHGGSAMDYSAVARFYQDAADITIASGKKRKS